MKEAYCSSGVTKLLEEKGFPKGEFTHYEYDPKGITAYKTCTHQKAMSWLREIHHIFIEISTFTDFNGKYHFSYTILDKECKYIRRGYTDFDWNYEDAVEAALKYTLENLI